MHELCGRCIHVPVVVAASFLITTSSLHHPEYLVPLLVPELSEGGAVFHLNRSSINFLLLTFRARTNDTHNERRVQTSLDDRGIVARDIPRDRAAVDKGRCRRTVHVSRTNKARPLVPDAFF